MYWSLRSTPPMSQLGKPQLTLHGESINIPGVQKGFAPSKARELTGGAMKNLFSRGDRVMHRKFGEGVVIDVIGTGAAARIHIEFTAYGVKEFALSIVPIIKLED